MSQSLQGNSSSTGDINILLLGQTGVGKTTFINAFANYLVYNSLDEAIDGKLQAPIPAWFLITDQNTFEEKIIKTGAPNENEKISSNDELCTKQCQSFLFKVNNRKLRFIDTPGIPCSQHSIVQDGKNFEDILTYISQYEYLNGICILLKPNEERLNILFRFCVKELLRHLHVQAKENLMFVFTNARSTSFQPGSCAPFLRELLRTLKEQSHIEIPFSRENSFLFDNEAFRYLALCKNGIEFDATEKQYFRRIWDNTIKEFSRLMSRIVKCDKHATRDTLSLNEAQQLIRKLSRPIGEITTLIQQNLQLAKQHKDDVDAGQTPTPHILPQIDAKVVSLNYSRTICTNDKCIKVIVIDGIGKVDYMCQCHLTGVESENIGNKRLKDDSNMDETPRNCTQCGCDLGKHMCITYEFCKFMTDIDMNINSNAQAVIETIEQRIKDLQTEQEEIIKVCAQLTQFLRANALNPLRDDVFDYIHHFIREERTKNNVGVLNDDVIAGLERLLCDNARLRDIPQDEMIDSQTITLINPSDTTNTVKLEKIFLLIDSLYRLPINGVKIQAQVNELKRIEREFSQNREQTVNLPTEADSSSLMTDLKNILA